jgi:hypothetical protein
MFWIDLTFDCLLGCTNVQFDKIYRYHQQFRLRMENNPTRSWASIDDILWFTIIANGSSLNTTSPQIQVSYRSCWDYNFKGLCNRQLCNYKHACLKCGLKKPVYNMWACSWFGYNWVSLFNSEIFMGVKARHHISKGFIKTSERKQNYLGIVLWWKLNYWKSSKFCKILRSLGKRSWMKYTVEA